MARLREHRSTPTVARRWQERRVARRATILALVDPLRSPEEFYAELGALPPGALGDEPEHRAAS